MNSNPARNLVIVHTLGNEALSDWVTVKEKIEIRAPDIEVRIAENFIPNSVTRRWQIRRPSLVFSVAPLVEYKPWGGTIYCGKEFDKFAQFIRLNAAGLPMPRSVRLTPGLALNPAVWGDYVIVKPSGVESSRGQLVRLIRTETITALYDELTQGGQLKMLVQKYIDATDHAGRIYECRVLTMFGHPIYLLKGVEVLPRPSLAEVVDQRNGEIAYNRRGLKRELRLVVEEDVLGLARRTAQALPEFACLGIDIARDRSTGQLYVLEVNTRGAIWHISSPVTPRYPAEVRDNIYRQFSALDTAAGALIERTRGEAS
jgi:hypothetical protein